MDTTTFLLGAWADMNDKQKHHARKSDRENNSLTQLQTFQLWNALKGLEKEFQAEKPTLQQAAERMTREMGFTVTVHNLRWARKNAVISWNFPRQQAGSSHQSKLRDEVQAIVSIVRDRMEWQEKLIRHLYRELNIPFPEHQSMAPVSKSEA